MTASLLTERTTKLSAAAAAAELEAERLAERTAALQALERLDADLQTIVAPSAEASRKARIRLERTKKAMEEAQTAFNEAARQHDLEEFTLSNARDRALNMIVQTADPQWIEFEPELRDIGAKALEGRYDLLTSGGSFGPQTVNREHVAHNARCKAFWAACQKAIEFVRERKRDPNADVAEIAKLRDALPSIETNNA